MSRSRPAEPNLSDPTLFLNRDLSWLTFNQRVLAQARDDSHPLLERVKFLAIAANNLDEFHMVGLASLLREWRAGVDTVSPDGLDITTGWTPLEGPRATCSATSRRAGTSCGCCSPDTISGSSSEKTTRPTSTSS